MEKEFISNDIMEGGDSAEIAVVDFDGVLGI